jgi:hypothetical protein
MQVYDHRPNHSTFACRWLENYAFLTGSLRSALWVDQFRATPVAIKADSKKETASSGRHMGMARRFFSTK